MNPTVKPPFPGFFSAIGVIALAKIAIPAPIALSAFIGGALLGVPDAYTHPAVEAASLFAAATGIAWFYRRQTGTAIRVLFGQFPRRLSLLPPFVATVAAYTLLQSTFTAAMASFFPSLSSHISSEFPQHRAYIFTAVCLAGPLAEEITYRGVLLRGFVPRYGQTQALLFTAALFAALHVNPIRLPGTFLFGMWTGWLTLRTRSLWPSLLFHSITNTLFFALAALGYTDQQAVAVLRESHPARLVGFIAAALALFAAGVFSIRRGTMEIQ